MVGRDGSEPLMVCLVPLINKDPLHHFTHSMKVSDHSFKVVCGTPCLKILHFFQLKIIYCFSKEPIFNCTHRETTVQKSKSFDVNICKKIVSNAQQQFSSNNYYTYAH